jgi:zinc protease
MIHRLRGVCGLLAAMALAGLALGGPAAIAQPSPAPIWAQQASDLPADPAVTFGVLPNGLRYAVMRNATPPGQVSMRLLIKAGSMQEKPGQEGLAHFLEHLAFRGSTHLADGEVFPMLERLGLARGADSNAGTGAGQTVYQFDLPKADDATVDTGLMVLREIAGELLLTQETMDGERGVILSEERARDTPGLHAGKALNRLLLGDHPYARPTIGERSVIETAPVSRLRDFYEAYYRPERSVLVIVGDIDPAAVVGKLTARFADWRGKGQPGTDPPPFAPTNGEQARFYSEAGLAPQMVVAWTAPPLDRRHDRAFEIERQHEALAFAVINKRYADISMGAKPPFVGAGASGSEIRHVARMTQLSAVAPTDWRTALSNLIVTQRQAVEFGVRQEELDRVIVQMRTGLQSAVASAPSRRTPALVGGLLSAAQLDQVYMSPAQRLAVFEEAARTITVEKANALIRSRFTGAGPTVFVATPSAADGDQAALEKVLAEARSRSVTALADVDIKPWPYTDFGPAGQVVERRRIEDVDATLVRFANGVRLTIKPTDYTKSQILVRVRTGFGLLDLPNDRLTAMSGFGTRIIDGGLADLTPIEVRRTLEGKVVSAGSGISDQGFTFGGVTRPQDFDLQMQVLAAYHVKPGWRTDGLAERLQLAKTMYAQAESTPNGVFGRYAGLLLHSGDMRWKQPDPEELTAMRPEEVQAFMTAVLAKAPIDVVIVGDIDVEKAIAATARTFGALPAREQRSPDPAGRRLKFPAPTPKPVVLRHKGRSDQALAFVAWPIPGYHDHQASLRLRLLQLIINDRLFDRVRTKEGKTYSPGGDLSTPLAFPDYGYLMESIETPPAQIPSVMAAIDQIVTDLATTEVSLDELDRVRRPRIELWRRNLTTNGFWAATLDGVWDDEDVLTPARTNVTAFAKVTPAELKAAAKAYLSPERAFRLTVVPDPLITASGTRP